MRCVERSSIIKQRRAQRERGTSVPKELLLLFVALCALSFVYGETYGHTRALLQLDEFASRVERACTAVAQRK
jgi:hypothetical protein